MQYFTITFLIAILATVTWVFDYVMKPEQIANPRLKQSLHAIAIAFIWLLFVLQLKAGLKADQDTQEVKDQLRTANGMASNSLATATNSLADNHRATLNSPQAEGHRAAISRMCG